MPGEEGGSCFGDSVSLCGDACGRMERWRGRVAAVTGASSGIGAAIAYQLQDAGVTVIGLARRAEKIPEAVVAAREAAASRGRVLPADPVPGELHTRAMDVTSEDDVLAAFAWIKDTFGRLDIFVNNAGIVGETALTESGTDAWRSVLDVNVLGASVCSREAVRLMREREDQPEDGDGHLVNINSIVGHMDYVKNEFSMYVASKNALRILTEGMRRELIDLKSRIRITSVSPGLVKTEFFDGYEKFVSGDWFQFPHIFAEDIADAVLYAIGTPSHVQVHEMIVKPTGGIL